MLQRARLAVSASLLVLLVGTAHGALTKDQFKCQKTVAKQGRVFFKKRFNALAKCNDAINQGTLPTTTDCTVETKTQPKLDSAEAKLRAKIGLACPTDMLVASLDFGDQCAGVATITALANCQVLEHEAAVDAVLKAAYGDDTKHHCKGGTAANGICTVAGDCPMGTCVPDVTERVCDGGGNNGLPCTDTAACPSGACVTTPEQQACSHALGKALGKLAGKRQAIVQSCKKKVATGKLPLSTDCVAAGQAMLDSEVTKTLDAVRTSCPTPVSSTMAFGGACELQSDPDSVTACGSCTVGKQTDELILTQHGSSAHGGTALAKQITDVADCVGGPMSRCRANDYLIRNDKIRVVIQDIQRNMFGIGQFGGQIIDGDIVRQPLDPDRDNFEEWSVSLNIESTAHYTSVTVLRDGSDGGPAVIRATGVDDLLDFINPSSTVAGFGFLLPPSADDKDIPVTITTDYILEPGTDYVRVETTVQNTGASLLKIFFGEYINGSGQIEMFQPGYGFGEPLVSTRCLPVLSQDVCNFTAYSGFGDADGVSYGYIQQTPGSSTFSTSGVHVPQLRVEAVLALVGLATPPFTMQPSGNPGDSLEFTRYFVVGDGSVSAVSDARNEIQCLPTGRVQGTVTAGGNPVALADVAVFGDLAKGPSTGALNFNEVTHAKTDVNGHYSLTLPPGLYNVAANLESSPYEGGGPTAVQHPITVAAFGNLTQDIALPATGALDVTVKDEDDNPIPAKVSVVGFDPSPDPLNNQNIFGLINNTTGIFADRGKDGLPFGIAASHFIGLSGDSGVVPLEPGNYQVVVSHGPEYSIDAQNITVTAGSTTNVTAKVEHVIDTTGFVSADYHVHSIDSPDSQIAHIDRVLTMLGEGVDFFASTDHDYRFAYQPIIDAMGATDRLGTAVGEEITSFDYGHFNGWPLKTDLTQVNHGAVDFGGAAPDGQDYPSAGNYSLTPAAIIAQAHADKVGANNTVQVNHIHSHFGLDGGSGLAIDTGVNPPQSLVSGTARRLNPAVPNYFTDTFDALEIWIGDDRQGQILTNFLGQNIGDWFNLINQGIVRTGIADSDTHKRTVSPAGFPRNMVASSTDDPADLSADADTLSVNVNAGRTIGTDGPMVRVSAHAVSTNETAKLELGFPTTIRTTDGAVDVTVKIQSPTWAEFDRVEYYVNTKTTRVLKTGQQTGAGTITMKRYTITPDFVQTKGVDFTVNTVPVAGTSSSRLEATTTLNLTGLTEDTWIVVLVKGSDTVSHPLFPMIPNSIKTSTNTTLAQLTDGNLGEDGVLALAFTNPLFVDVDGGGYTAPGLNIAP